MIKLVIESQKISLNISFEENNHDGFIKVLSLLESIFSIKPKPEIEVKSDSNERVSNKRKYTKKNIGNKNDEMLVPLTRSRSNSKREEVEDLIRQGLKNGEIHEQTGAPLGSIATWRNRLNFTPNKKKSHGELPDLGPEVIGLIIDTKRSTELSDLQIGFEYDITAEQVRLLWDKYHDDPKYRSMS